MKNLIGVILILLLSSCSTTRDKINEANTKIETFKQKADTEDKENATGPEKLKWFTILKTSQGTIAQEINKSIVKISGKYY